MSQYGPPTTTVGGHGWKHMCSMRLQFKSESVDANGGYLPESNQNPKGVKINAALTKNKTAPRDRRLSHYVIDFEDGFNIKLDIVNAAVILGIVVQRGAGFSYTTDEGELISGLGRAKFIEKLDVEQLEEINRRVNEYDD